MSCEEYHWNYVQSSTRMCVERAFGMLKGRWRILLKRIDVHLKNVPNLVAACLVLHNMCIIFCDQFWKDEWMREATDDVRNGLTTANIPGSSMQERLAVANEALHTLAGIDENSRETLENIKQEDAQDCLQLQTDAWTSRTSNKKCNKFGHGLVTYKNIIKLDILCTCNINIQTNLNKQVVKLEN